MGISVPVIIFKSYDNKHIELVQREPLYRAHVRPTCQQLYKRARLIQTSSKCCRIALHCILSCYMSSPGLSFNTHQKELSHLELVQNSSSSTLKTSVTSGFDAVVTHILNQVTASSTEYLYPWSLTKFIGGMGINLELQSVPKYNKGNKMGPQVLHSLPFQLMKNCIFSEKKKFQELTVHSHRIEMQPSPLQQCSNAPVTIKKCIILLKHLVLRHRNCYQLSNIIKPCRTNKPMNIADAVPIPIAVNYYQTKPIALIRQAQSPLQPKGE